MKTIIVENLPEKAFVGDLVEYKGTLWVYLLDKWIPLEEANKMIFLVDK